MSSNKESPEDHMNGLNSIGPDVFALHKMALIGRLMRGIVHDVKNPLAIILQSAEFLECTGTLDDSSRHMLEMIKNASFRIDGMLENIMSFTMPSQKVTEITDIDALIEESIGLLRYQLNTRHIQVEKKLPTFIAGFKADRNDIKHALINVLLNAIDAVPEKGVVTIEARQVHDQPEKDYVAIIITDNGPGIAEGEGKTGLGITITRNLIGRYNGRLSIESSAGRGTSVVLTMPAV